MHVGCARAGCTLPENHMAYYTLGIQYLPGVKQEVQCVEPACTEETLVEWANATLLEGQPIQGTLHAKARKRRLAERAGSNYLNLTRTESKIGEFGWN